MWHKDQKIYDFCSKHFSLRRSSIQLKCSFEFSAETFLPKSNNFFIHPKTDNFSIRVPKELKVFFKKNFHENQHSHPQKAVFPYRKLCLHSFREFLAGDPKTI